MSSALHSRACNAVPDAPRAAGDRRGTPLAAERGMVLARRAVRGSAASFVVIIALAMIVYPGGTSWNRASPGHDFWLNYLCDLARPTALNGVPNPIGSALAQAAMAVLAFGLLPWWWLLARLAPSQRRSGIAVRALGTIAVLGIFGVVLLPGDRFGALHGFACVAAGVPGLTAALVAVVALLRDQNAPRAPAWLGAITLGVASICFALYVPDVLRLSSAVMAVAVLERISLGLLLVWMLVCSAACRTS
jgi:hypothetical protein